MVKELTVKDTLEFTLWEMRADQALAEIEEAVEERIQMNENEGHGDMFITNIHIEKVAPHPHPISHNMIPEHYNITVEYEYERAEEFFGERNDFNG